MNRISTSLVSCMVGVSLTVGAFAQDLPPFLERIIAEYGGEAEVEAPDDPPVDSTTTSSQVVHPSRLEIWRYEYQGQQVYYLPFARTHCCDAMSMLYDSDGKLLCMPDGGITGDGDGRCPDFSPRRSPGVLVHGPTPASQEVGN